MRKFVFVVLLCVAVSAAFAGPCSGKCGAACGVQPKSAYTYSDPHYIPDCASPAMERFHNKLVPMLEARKSHEASYIRGSAEELYRFARDLAKDKACCEDMNKKPYKKAAKDLTKSCDRLRDICFGGTNDAVYEQMRNVEEDYVRLINLCN